MSSWFESSRATPVVFANATVHEKQFCYQPYGRYADDGDWEKKHVEPNARAWEKQLTAMGIPQPAYGSYESRKADILVGYKGLKVGDPVMLVEGHQAGHIYPDHAWYEWKNIKTVGTIVKVGRRKAIAFKPEFAHLATEN